MNSVVKEKLSLENSYIVMAGLLLMAAISYYFFLLQQAYPPCCDALSYAAIAAKTNSMGFLESQIPLRTFAYPLLLSGVAKVSSLLNVNYLFLVFLFQFTLYAIAVINALSFFAGRITSVATRTAILLFLCCNIYVAPYIAITLTDSIYISLCIIVITNICRLFADAATQYSLICVTAFLAALAIVIRPTAIWLAAPLIFYFALLIFSGKVNYFRLAGVIAIAVIPLGIQIFINYSRFDTFTFFPATDLGSAQVEWGIKHLKYATWMAGGIQPNYYPSSELINAVPGDSGFTIMWYFSNIVAGIKLIFVKFVGAFDFDHLLPYPYFVIRDFWVPSLLSFAFMFFGVCGVVYHALTANLTSLGHRFLPGVIFISWGAITLVSALELRFTLPVLCYFMIVSCLYVHELKVRNQKKAIVFSVVGFLITLPFLIKVALFVRAQSSISG